MSLFLRPALWRFLNMPALADSSPCSLPWIVARPVLSAYLTDECVHKLDAAPVSNSELDVYPLLSVCRLLLPFEPSGTHTIAREMDVFIDGQRHIVVSIGSIRSSSNALLQWNVAQMPGPAVDLSQKMKWLPILAVQRFLPPDRVDSCTGYPVAAMNSDQRLVVASSVQHLGFSLHYCCAPDLPPCSFDGQTVKHVTTNVYRILFPDLARLEIDRDVADVEPELVAVLEQDQLADVPVRVVDAHRAELEAEIGNGPLEENVEGLDLFNEGMELGEDKQQEEDDPTLDYGDLSENEDEKDEEKWWAARTRSRAHRAPPHEEKGEAMELDTENVGAASSLPPPSRPIPHHVSARESKHEEEEEEMDFEAENAPSPPHLPPPPTLHHSHIKPAAAAPGPVPCLSRPTTRSQTGSLPHR
jgi:hypothetical protein